MSETTIAARSAGPGIRAWMTLIGAELRMVIRDTAGLIVPIGLPLLILVMNGLGLMGAGNETLPGTGGMTIFDVYVMPLVLTMVVATIGVINMPSFLAYYRKSGVLKRLAVTPVHPSMVLGAQLVVSTLQTAVGVALAFVAAMTLFGASLPSNLLLALGVFALAALAMYAIGLLIAAVAPSGNASVALGLVAFFAMAAIGGLFGPTEILPDPLRVVGEALPFGAAQQAMAAAWVGDLPNVASVVSLVVTIVIGGSVAARFFRWQ
jgi:ABC-2 type transport system permease protein